jgi:acyl-CoA synthetase (AMP-forming)/AMP-acid ligase II
MDWDSHRYLECFFAIPMMGAVLQTVNVRLAPEQILYTLNHAGADILLFNAEFAPIVASVRDNLETVRKFVLISDGQASQDLAVDGAYEPMLATANPKLRIPRVRREYPGNHVLHHRHDRCAEGGLFQPSAARAAYPRPPRRRRQQWEARPSASG